MGYYAWQTKKSVIALEESTKAQFKPFLKGALAQIGPDSLDLQIINIGKGAAEEITVNFRTIEFEGSQRTYNLTSIKDSLYLLENMLMQSNGISTSLETTKQQ